MCELLRIALINGGKFTGGASGLDLPPIGTVFGVKLDKLSNAYMLVAGFMFVSMFVAWRVANSGYGRTLRSIRENEQLSKSLGVNTNLYKVGAFMLSGLFAGVGGDLQAY